MKRILAQCIKELVQFRRDRLTLALAFLLPFLTLLIFGFAIRLESKNIPLIVQDFDRTNLSSSYIERLYATNQFIPYKWSGTDPVRDAVDRGIAKAAVIIPPEFSRDVKASKNTELQVLIDATDVNNARVIKNSIQQVTNFFMRDQGLVPATSSITPKMRLWFNPGRLESLYIVPGVYGVVLWIFPSLLSAIAMVREKEKGTILQVYTSSISATELLLGKGIAYLLIAIAEALVLMVLGSLIFHVGLVAEPTALLIGTFLLLTDSVMFGLLLGVRSSNQNSAVQGVALIGFITALLLSGFIYPLNNIPFPLSLVPNVVPARYYIDITRDAFVRGTGWAGVWFDLVMLAILGLIFFNISRRVLSRMQLPN
ncbi:MAG: ABC transporter permease [Fischerella sp.]|jgi:ABC-2 type transport system permease protein|uniref:ABC transporter permease n=1 Tax=Fischerella sp. TaxID=1191 RepID=UPI001817435F|nr:ABC transporter permease [Fischerella sp.]NWF60990.1 ABC transporter permease [Fischerella sp.]